MKRLVLTPLVVAAALAAGAVSGAEDKDAQSYGYTDREGATYQEPIADEPAYRAGDAYAQVYGDGRADDYHDYGDYRPYEERYGDGIVSGVAGSGARGDALIVPDRYGRDGEFAMARVLRVTPLVSRDAGCSDGRYADGGAPYRGQVVNRDGVDYGDGRYEDEYYQDEYHEGGYPGSGDDGYYDPRYGQSQGYADPYGRPPPRTSGMGAAIGAIIGGVIGNEIADDDHPHGYYGYSGEQAAATMIGALLGGAVGAGIERQVVQNREQRYHEQQRRQSMYRGQPAGGYDGGHAACDAEAYRVEYEYAGRRYEAVTDYDPGDELRVRIEI
jgi:uncharacterized protein YcfJ